MWIRVFFKLITYLNSKFCIVNMCCNLKDAILIYVLHLIEIIMFDSMISKEFVE